MKNFKTKVVINDRKESQRLERFVEDICELHNISNEYFGNILLAVTQAAEILFAKCAKDSVCRLNVSFAKSVKGYQFHLSMVETEEGKHADDDNFDRELRKFNIERDIVIVKSIADETFIDDSGKGIILFFNIDGIDLEKSLNRVSLLKSFWSRSPNMIPS